MGTYVKFFEPYEKELAGRTTKKGLTITVDGLVSSGKSTGAKAIAEALGLGYVWIGKIQREYAEKRKLPLEKQTETREPEIDIEMDRTILEKAMKGKCVIDARICGWVSGNHADIRIFYDPPFEIRVERYADREKVSLEKAREEVGRRDQADIETYKKLYGIDMNDKNIFDIIIDNSKFTEQDAKTKPVELVKKSLKEKVLQ
jgi:cytidylate kinase